MKRLLGAAMMASMLHLSLVASDLVCVTHGQAHPPPVAAHSHAVQHHGHAPSKTTHDSRDCAAPVAFDCCQALTSCSTNMAVVASSTAESGPRDDAPPAHVVDVPLSRVVAPETPPPKA